LLANNPLCYPGVGRGQGRSTADLRPSGLPSLQKMPKVIFPRSALVLYAAERPCPLPTPLLVPADWPLSPSSSARQVTRRQKRRYSGAFTATSYGVVEPELCRSGQSETARPVAWHNARPWGAPDSVSGIKDPHRVSQETVAPGDVRASRRDAGQPQNESGTPRGRTDSSNGPSSSRASPLPHRLAPTPAGSSAPWPPPCMRIAATGRPT